ncbi:MAG: nucleotidyl transferase AbiEii/AbiGii toxin family protein [Deltaproteobacteria bacterium]|nr:nucleotidyl transferase AbiEii/AbiGii toxin family protein [Deltaproteobacteria bacterium]
MEMKFREVFQLLAERFETEHIDYALVGAFALKAYGYVRATQDVDFIVRAEVQDKVVAYVESLGYETLHRSPGFSNHIHALSKLGRIDFVYVKGDTADRIFSQAKRILVLGDLSLPVASPEHLAALKVFAMKNDPERRFKEMADIKFLLGVPGIDQEAVKHSFEKYGQLERYYELTGKK